MIEFTAIPAFSSNYIWLIANNNNHEVYIVDPGIAKPVIEHLKRSKLQPKGILITHSHEDHIGGIQDIKAVFDIPVYGPRSGRIPQITDVVEEDSSIELWPETHVRVMEVPGHLPEHVAYYLDASESAEKQQALFCGDAMFSSGCGRIFDGTPAELHQSLQKMAKLPNETQVYCAHEYTLANIDFALHIEPNNAQLIAKREWSKAKLNSGEITLPSTLASEKETNPFLRCHIQELKTRVAELSGQALQNDIETFAAIRTLKDNY